MEWSDMVCEVAAVSEPMEWTSIELDPEIDMEWEQVKECVWRN